MFRVFACLTEQHDWRLIIVAGVICFMASATVVTSFNRARGAADRFIRTLWIISAGVASGCGIWATHFIAMLAYDPGVVIGYNIAFTALSLLAAALITTLGLAIAVGSPTLWAGALGGAVVGGGIASMHYLGMTAVELPGRIGWDVPLVVNSVVLGMAFGAGALAVAQHRADKRATVLASLLFTLAIISHHFTAMAAVAIVPDPARLINPWNIAPTALAFVIAIVAFAVLGLSLAGLFADRLHDRDRRLAIAINNMTHGVVLFNAENRLIAHNDRYIAMYGLSRELVKPGTPLVDILRHRVAAGTLSADPERYGDELLRELAAGRTINRVVEHDDGRAIAVVTRPLDNGDWISTHEDITDRRAADRRIAHMAHHDMLTGLPNRLAFSERLAATLAEARAREVSFAVLCIDFDRFKEINDFYGHAIGDVFLKTVAARMRAVAGEQFLARLSGDEFAMILAGGDMPEAARAMAKRLLVSVAGEAEIEHCMLRVSLSIGVAIFPQDGIEATTLVANADAALYDVKAARRGTVRFFDSTMDKARRQRRELQHDLRAAQRRNELRIHYQPQATIDGDSLGFEALLRWQHPTRGLVPPSQFIPLAEESGTIVELGEWILAKACREAASWPKELQIAVNVSPIQFRHGDLAQTVHRILRETGLSPDRLEIEITEGVLVDDFARALSILRSLKALGTRIALDDFGTGYSSLSYLQAFPFDKIKIDRSFVANLANKPQSAAIVRATIGLAHALRMRVIAEGVETRAQLDILAREGCDEVQGYLIGKPARIEHYAALLGRPALTHRASSAA